MSIKGGEPKQTPPVEGRGPRWRRRLMADRSLLRGVSLKLPLEAQVSLFGFIFTHYNRSK